MTLLLKGVIVGYRTFQFVEKIKNLIVLDNSVVMRWFFNDGSIKGLEYAESLLFYMKENNMKPVVPTLWVSEACFVSGCYVKNKDYSPEIVKEKLTNAFEMFLIVDPRIEPIALFEYAQRFNLSEYDANYALLADSLSCPVATLDKKLIKAVVKSDGKIFK